MLYYFLAIEIAQQFKFIIKIYTIYISTKLKMLNDTF